MPQEAYLRDEYGNFIGDKWHPKSLNPEIPEDCLNQAGQLSAAGLARLHTLCPVAIIQNGGEYGLNVLGWVQKQWEQDPKVVAAKGNLNWALAAKGYELRFGMKNSCDYLCAEYKQNADASIPPVWDATASLDNNAKGFGDLRLYEGFLKCLYTEGMIGSSRRTGHQSQGRTRCPMAKGELSPPSTPPDEVYHGLRPAHRQPRFEPRPSWPRCFPCAAPVTLVKAQPGVRLKMEVAFSGAHRYVPIVRLTRAV